MPIVDVRDVAWAHVQAMTAPGAAGQRILLASGRPIAMKRIGAILKENVPDAAGKVPTRTIPDLVVRLIALFRPEFRTVAADLNFVKNISTEKAVALLGWQPRDSEDAIIAAAQSMIAKSLVA